MKLSLIVRSYNGSKYIIQALDSIKNEFLHSTEVIVVDNGSSDNTIQIVKNYIFKNKNLNIKLIEQKNLGPGGALNTGIKESNSEYVGFLDSDDFFISNSGKKIFDQISLNNADIIEFGFLQFSTNLNTNYNNFYSLYRNLSGFYLLKDIKMQIFSRTNWYPFTRIFKRNLFKEILFPNFVHYEDDMTIYKVFNKAKTFYYFNKPYIAYRVHKKSITSNHTSKQMKTLIDFYNQLNSENEYELMTKVRLARTLSYLFFELNVFNDLYFKIRKEIKFVKLNKKQSNNIKFLDKFYKFYPEIYDFINRIRIKLFKI